LNRNWDWKSSASSSLIYLDILAHPPTNRPNIKMMTEAGVIGKIGVNELGVSVMLNALKVSIFSSVPRQLSS
jgi:isopenicillin-N N-acyltransferase-like protein